MYPFVFNQLNFERNLKDEIWNKWHCGYKIEWITTLQYLIQDMNDKGARDSATHHATHLEFELRILPVHLKVTLSWVELSHGWSWKITFSNIYSDAVFSCLCGDTDAVVSKTRIWQSTYFSSIFIFISLGLHPTSSKPQHTAGFSGSLTHAFF